MNKPLVVLAFLAIGTLLTEAQEQPANVQRELKSIDHTVAAGPFRDDWNSLKQMKVPDWFRDAKFGIFIHWGAYSVPAWGNEWYPRNMYQKKEPEFAHHIEIYGPQNKFGYKDFLPQFTGDKFDADQWADLFRRAGAKYVIEVAEHHDGFAMYDTQFSEWKATKMGPHRDVIAELGPAVRKAGLHFGISYHRAEHWWFFDGGRTFDSDVNDPKYASFYGPAQPQRLPGADRDNQPDAAFLSDWLARSGEIVEKYHPDLWYYDWWVGQPAFEPYLRKFAAFYYDEAAKAQQPVVMYYKEKAMPQGTAVHDVERGKLAAIQPEPWQTDTSISYKSWGYLKDDSLRTPKSIVQDLVDIVSKNGCLLLNVGPKPDGTISEDEQKILLAVGEWLSLNGEAIYGSRPWTTFGEGPTQVKEGSLNEGEQKPFTSDDIRFIRNHEALYAISMDWPKDGSIRIRSLDKELKVRSVLLVGSAGKVSFKQDAEGLWVELPKDISDELLPVLKIEFRQ
ncbi:Alpha-L-fucosidase [Candidatus Koribacter versatilis Ellin345]|uniref:alpha-L-fucosidase n=1 Tax=Koribacter versatilis (strain Ellin345) TaxID=204669 RepID=Q1IT95_KORVE|nr:alpha-L-fucosidase [Candidatus Koribacter versatilis]ABF39905.1 Alpha-L-fucosidase [Candidatus Koribacter versatilis Ellin345]